MEIKKSVFLETWGTTIISKFFTPWPALCVSLYLQNTFHMLANLFLRPYEEGWKTFFFTADLTDAEKLSGRFYCLAHVE